MIHRSLLTTGNLNSFLVPAPSSSEQLQIAHFLDRETARIDAHFSKGAGTVNRAASPLENSAL
jgi:restriction endonuclease S subunit